MKIKPIETFYAGHKFRSRLEARYAVFFSRLRIDWQYEAEGYVLPNGDRYLPDFFLPTFGGGMYVEVKPTDFIEEEKEKCRQLCIGTQKSVWLAKGIPDYWCYEVYYWNQGEITEGDGIPNADQAEHENRMFGMSAYGEPGEMIKPEYRKLMGGTLDFAIKEAKEAQFEFINK